MGVPTKQELEQALATAVQMREQNTDENHLAKALLNLNYRLHTLEKVMDRAKLFLHSGLAAEEHAALQKAIDQAERAATRAGDEHQDFGLE